MSFEGDANWLMNDSGGNNASSLAERPPFGIMVMEENGVLEEKDITVLHSKWDGEKARISVPGRKRSAVQWQAAHTYYAHDGHEMFICNICGRDLKLSGSVSSITAHLTHRHPGIKERMEEMDKQDQTTQQKKRIAPTKNAAVQKKARTKPESGNKAHQQQKQKQHLAVSKAAPQKLLYSKEFKGGGSFNTQKTAQVKLIVGCNFPMHHAESPWQKKWMETTVAATKAGATVNDLMLTQKDITATVFAATKKLREHLKERIKKGKSLCGATEHHRGAKTAITHSTFRVQWIEGFALQSAVLAVHGSKLGRHHNQQHGNDDYDTTKLQEWDLWNSKMLKFVVTDTPSLETNAFGLDIHYNKSEMEQIYCLEYLLDFVARAAFNGILGQNGNEHSQDDSNHRNQKEGVAEGLLRKVSGLIRHFQNSIQASIEVMKIAEQLNDGKEPGYFVLDTSGAWWSTQIMVERFLGLREAVTTYLGRQWIRSNKKKNRPPKMSEEEWELLEDLCFVLRPLRFAHQLLKESLRVTAPLVPLVVHLIYQDLEKIRYADKENNEIAANIASVAGQMLDKMNQVFGDFCSRAYKEGSDADPTRSCQVNIHKAIVYAHALDPRFKALSVFPADVQGRIWEGLLEEMVSLGPSGDAEIAPPPAPMEMPKPEKQHHTPAPASTGAAAGDAEDAHGSGSIELDSLFKLYSHKQQNTTTAPEEQPEQSPAHDWHKKCEIELKLYRESDGMEPNIDKDILLDWWSEKTGVYPNLWRLAQCYFSISATSAPPRRAFSLSASSAIHREGMSGSDEMLYFLQENASFIRNGRFLGVS